MANPHYASLSGMPLPPTSSSSSSDKLETISNYDTEPAPSYFDKSYSYDKYMAEFPRAPGSPSNSSQVELLSQFADSNSHQNLEQLQSATGFGAGLVCLCAETLVGYPFIVLRRQCQVNMWCKAADLSPYLMLKAIYQIQKRQGMPALWKGFTCHMMMEGLQLTTDSCISHVTQLPKELPSFSEGLTRTMGYVTLKTVSTIATLPILSAVLLDTVQSESARAESATPMSCLKDAIYRFTGSGSSYQYRLLLPVHQLIIPTVVYTLTWDLVGHLVHSSVLKLCKMRQNSKQSDKDSRRQPNNTLVLRRTASDSFLTITYYMILEKTQEALLRLLHQIKQEIPQVVAVADGPDTADLMRRYLIEGDVSVTLEHVTDAKLVNFVSRMWSHTWAGHCFNSLNRTRTETAIRVYTTMSQYKHMIRGIETAVEFIPKLRKYAKEHFSEHCKDALVKAGLFEGAGCQMCAPGIAGAPVCSEYCLNVAKGCMRPILCYLTQWKEWIRHQQSITRELLTVSGERRKFLGTLMTTFETEMLEHAPQYRIYGECTPPETPTKGEQAVKYKVASLVPPVLLHSRDLFIRRFSDLLTSLPQQFCEEMMGKQPVTENCWNGLDTSGYQKPPSLFNMEDQKCNPEVLPERLPCDLATAGKNLECDRGSYLMTGYAATPSVEPPGRAGSGGLVGHPTQFYVCLFVSLFLLSR